MAINRKWHAVDLMTLYTKTSFKEWNAFLTMCVEGENIAQLEKTYYGIQAGMDKLVKLKLNTDEMNIWYLRLAKSIEKTVKLIYRKKHPSPLDDPKMAVDIRTRNPAEYKVHLKRKRNRDVLYETWLRKVSF